MRTIPTAIVGLFLVSPAMALPTVPPGYDLKCEGNMSGLNGDDAPARATAFTMTLHVDLDHKLFCQNNCEAREKISKVLPTNIIFRAVSTPLPNRLWVADNGQFSYTWADAAAQGEKPSLHSAQGFCTKVVSVSPMERENVKQKAPIPAVRLSSGQKTANRFRSEDLSAREISALISIQNHRPIPASMHTTLWLKGLAQFDDNLWVLTDKGEALIGERR
jgi:hypothetical protein